MEQDYGELAQVLAPKRREYLEREIARSRNPLRKQTFQRMLDREAEGMGPMSDAQKQGFREKFTNQIENNSAGLPEDQINKIREAMNRGRGISDEDRQDLTNRIREQGLDRQFSPNVDVDPGFNINRGREIDRGFDPGQLGVQRPGSDGRVRFPGVQPGTGIVQPSSRPPMTPDQIRSQQGLARARQRVAARAADPENSGGNIGGRLRTGGVSFGGNFDTSNKRFL